VRYSFHSKQPFGGKKLAAAVKQSEGAKNFRAGDIVSAILSPFHSEIQRSWGQGNRRKKGRFSQVLVLSFREMESGD